MTSDRTHTGIRHTVSLHSEHVYKDNLWVETSVKMNYCAIFRCTTNTGHHREPMMSCVLRFLTNKMLKNWRQMFGGSIYLSFEIAAILGLF